MAAKSLRERTIRRRLARRGLVAVTLSVGMIAAGCSSGSSSGSSSSTSTRPAALTPPKDPAQGQPIVIGIYTPEDNALFTAPELIDGAQAAVDYVNNDLHGLGGRPIKLVSCKSDWTAPTLTSCANQLFQKKPLIIIPGPDAAAFTVQKIFDDSGIPEIGGASFTPPEYTAPNRSLFNGFSASLYAAMVHFAITEFSAKKLTTMAVDAPTNTAIKAIFVDPVAAAAGIPKPQYVPAPPGSADLTSIVAAALQTKPDVLLPSGLPCLPFFQAYQSLGANVPVILPDNCADAETLKQAGAQAEGKYFIELYNGAGIAAKAGDSPEAAYAAGDITTYSEQMAKYAHGAADTDFARAGFGTIMNIHALLGAMAPGALTREKVAAAFKATKNRANFLNTPYSCAAPPSPQYPSICAGSAYLVKVVNGKLVPESPFVPLNVLLGGTKG